MVLYGTGTCGGDAVVFSVLKRLVHETSNKDWTLTSRTTKVCIKLIIIINTETIRGAASVMCAELKGERLIPKTSNKRRKTKACIKLI